MLNKHQSDGREAAVNKDDESIYTYNVILGANEYYHLDNVKMLLKHNNVWLGRLAIVNIEQYVISPSPEALLFKSAPYRAGPKT